MKLYDNGSARQQFTETVYELLSSDPDNYRANQIIDAYDSVPCVEAVPVEIPWEELPSMDWRNIYVVCRDDPEQSGWGVLHVETILDEVVLTLRFLNQGRRQICLTESNYRAPWVPCYREPVRVQKCVFVSGERFRQLQAEHDALKQELMALKGTAPKKAEIV